MTYEQFKTTFNIKLNEQQDAAVRQVDGQTLLLAVPGSGKTTVIVTRIGYMLYCCGIEPESILTMTYTKAAVRDMGSRYIDKFGDRFTGSLEFRTINGICDKIIKQYERRYNRTAFKVIEESEASKIISHIYNTQTGSYLTEIEIKGIQKNITYCKNMMLTDDEICKLKIEGIDFPPLFSEYKKYMTEHSLMDYDDQLVYANMILKQCTDVLYYFQGRYKYINVDEAQDTSKIQHMIIRQLAGKKSKNLFMVGDEDQSIYGFRAAYPQALLEFEQIYPNARILLMETNYRSTAEIVQKANCFIKRNNERYDKNMRAVREPGRKIRRIELEDYNRQYYYLALLAVNCDTETAILYRNNESAIPLIDLLDKKGISYRTRQVEGLFFTHYTVQDISNIIRFAFNRSDSELFGTLYYKFNCRLKKETVQSAIAKHRKKTGSDILDTLLEYGKLDKNTESRVKALQTHLNNVPNLNSYTAIKRIVDDMGYGEYLEHRSADISKVKTLYSLARQNPEIKTFLERLGSLDEIIKRGSNTKEDSKIILSTIHSSKGLEYERVILIDVIDGILPGIEEHSNAAENTEEELAILEEERRLFYVGVTRAKSQLELVTYKKYFGQAGGVVSSFINQYLSEPEKKQSDVKTTKVQSSDHQILKPAAITVSEVSAAMMNYIPGVIIRHKAFGVGVITKKKDNIAEVKFETGITKIFDLGVCINMKLVSQVK